MRNKFKNLKIGLEVECILNMNKIDFLSVGGYHSGNQMKNKDGKYVNGWDVETDGSINKGRKFSSPGGIEFVSNIFGSRQEFFRGIDRFIEECESERGSELLTDALILVKKLKQIRATPHEDGE